MRIIIFYFLIFLVPIFGELRIEEEQNDVVDQIEKILQTNKFRKIVLIHSKNDSKTNLMQELSKMANYHYFPITTISIEDLKFFNRDYENFSYNAIYEESKINILLVAKMENFQEILYETTRLYYWRNRERTIVHFENGSKQELTSLFRLCWRKNITNIVFILSNETFTYNPFFAKYSIILNGTNVFYDKYVDMNGHLIKFSRFYTPLDMISLNNRDVGRDAFFANTLARAMNASYSYLAPRDNITYGLKFPNGSMTGVFHDIATEYADMAINSRMVKLQFENLLESTYPHDREDLGCLVPKSPKQPEYKKFTILFPELVWILLLVSMILYMFIWHLSIKKNREFVKVIFDVFALTLNYPIADQKGLRLRAILISYRFYIFLLITSYSALLTSVLTVPIQSPEINTLTDLDKSRIDIYAAIRFKDMLMANIDATLTASLVNRITTVPDDPEVNEVVNKRGHYAIIMKETFALRAVLEKENFLKNGDEIYRIMREKPMPSQVCYAVRFGSPILPRITYILRKFQESGLNEYWKESTKHLLTISSSMKMISDDDAGDEKLKVISFDNISAAYYILGIGLTGSLIIFIIENIWFKTKIAIEKKKTMKTVNQIIVKAALFNVDKKTKTKAKD